MSTTLTNKQEYQEKVKAQIEKINAKIDELNAKSAQAQADAKIEYQNKMEELAIKRDAVQATFEELQKSSEEAWQDIQKGFEGAWNELNQAFENAIANFQ